MEKAEAEHLYCKLGACVSLTTPHTLRVSRGPDDHFIVDQRPRGYAGVLDQLVKVRAFALCGLIVRS